MKALWNLPICMVYKLWNEGNKNNNDTTAASPVGDAMLTDFQCPLPEDLAWPNILGPGFIFCCSSQKMDECLGRGIFGLLAHMNS